MKACHPMLERMIVRTACAREDEPMKDIVDFSWAAEREGDEEPDVAGITHAFHEMHVQCIRQEMLLRHADR